MEIKTYGEYLNGFLIIKLLNIKLSDPNDKGKAVELENLSDEEKHTLYHEYIHYLQNISTTSGIMLFNHVSKIIQLYVNHIYESELVEIIIPINLEESKVKNAFQEDELQRLYLGDKRNSDVVVINNLCKEIIPDDDLELMELKGIIDEPLEIIKIYYDGKNYEFGRHCISESMAHLIELHISDKLDKEKVLPYNSCKIVCEKIYPDIANKNNVIVAMCEVSLMHQHSGVFFYELLNSMKTNQFLPKTVNDVYSYVKGKIGHLYKAYKSVYNESSDVVNFLYPPKDEGTYSANKWIKDIFKNAYDLRKKDNIFISKVMDLKPGKEAENYIKTLMNFIEIPIIVDEDNGVFSVQPNLYQILAPSALYSIFTEGSESLKCPIYEYCKNARVEVCGDICLVKPWEQVNKENLCPVAYYWHKYRLDDKQLKKKYA